MKVAKILSIILFLSLMGLAGGCERQPVPQVPHQYVENKAVFGAG